MANAKTVYADGDVIYREGKTCEHAFEVLSGTVDLLAQKDGKYLRQSNLEAGDTFGKPGLPYDVTLRARGRTVLRITEGKGRLQAKSNLPAVQQPPEASPQKAPQKESMIDSLMRLDDVDEDKAETTKSLMNWLHTLSHYKEVKMQHYKM